MPNLVLTDMVASITELKTNPMAVMRQANGQPLAILNRNEPAFYCVPPEIYAYFMKLAEDMELAKIVEERRSDESVKVNLTDLRR
ncbi:plasmid stabilization protein [Pasteurellaceae bacterium LIM206]|nr:plasmid stabilization protein [Pasteurellaceae bacterium LIM206]